MRTNIDKTALIDGDGDWGLGIGPIPNPQSPIPNPHILKILFNKYK